MENIHRAEVKINGTIEGPMEIDGVEFRDASGSIIMTGLGKNPHITNILEKLIGGGKYSSAEALKKDVAEAANIDVNDVTII